MQTKSITMRDFYCQSLNRELAREIGRVGRLLGDKNPTQTIERAAKLFARQFKKADTRRKAVVQWQVLHDGVIRPEKVVEACKGL